MRIKNKKMLYIMFLLITVLMFLHGWKAYHSSDDKSLGYAKKHHHLKHKYHHPLKKSHHYLKNTVLHA